MPHHLSINHYESTLLAPKVAANSNSDRYYRRSLESGYDFESCYCNKDNIKYPKSSAREETIVWIPNVMSLIWLLTCIFHSSPIRNHLDLTLSTLYTRNQKLVLRRRRVISHLHTTPIGFSDLANALVISSNVPKVLELSPAGPLAPKVTSVPALDCAILIIPRAPVLVSDITTIDRSGGLLLIALITIIRSFWSLSSK